MNSIHGKKWKKKGLQNMGIVKLLAGDNFVVLNRHILRHLGINQALLLAELASEQNFFEGEHKLTKDGFFYATIDNIEKNTTLSRKQQDAAIKGLVSKGLIEYKVQGMPASRYFRVKEEKFLEILSEKGSPQFVQKGQTSLPNETNKSVQKEQTSLTIKDNLVCPKGTGKSNYIKVNKKSNKEVLEHTLISTNCNLPEDVKTELANWMDYKSSRGQPIESDQTLTLLISDTAKAVDKYGNEKTIEIFRYSIRNNYSGLYFDRLHESASAKPYADFQQREYDFGALETQLLRQKVQA